MLNDSIFYNSLHLYFYNPTLSLPIFQMQFFGNKKGSAIPLSKANQLNKHDRNLSNKSKSHIDLTISDNQFKYLRNELYDNYKELALIIKSSNESTEAIESARKHMLIQMQIQANKKGDHLQFLTEESRAAFKEDEVNELNEKLEQYYAGINNKLRGRLEILIKNIKTMCRKEAEQLFDMMFFQDLRDKLNKQNELADMEIESLKLNIKEQQKQLHQQSEVVAKLDENAKMLLGKRNLKKNDKKNTNDVLK